MSQSPTTTINLRCECGALRGRIHGCSPRRVNRGVCYCDDCQAFARHLGRAAQTLDESGGTEILQFSSGMLELDTGKEHLACLQLTENALLRWYAACCRTPIGNTLRKGWIPFVGLVATCIDPAVSSADLERAAGPNRIRVHTKYGLTDPDALAQGSPGAMTMMTGLIGVIGGGWLRREHKRSPFFDASGEPVATPEVVTAAELERAKTVEEA